MRATSSGEGGGSTADPRPQGAAAYDLGSFKAAHRSSELDTTFRAWAVPALGSWVMQDLNTQLWYQAPLPQDGDAQR